MKVLKLDSNDDWTLKILKEPEATIQAIKTRLRCFRNDCYFDLDFGLDLNSFGKYAKDNLLQQVRAIITDTENVNQVKNVDFNFNADRKLTITFNTTILNNSINGSVDLTV